MIVVTARVTYAGWIDLEIRGASIDYDRGRPRRRPNVQVDRVPGIVRPRHIPRNLSLDRLKSRRTPARRKPSPKP